MASPGPNSSKALGLEASLSGCWCVDAGRKSTGQRACYPIRMYLWSKTLWCWSCVVLLDRLRESPSWPVCSRRCSLPCSNTSVVLVTKGLLITSSNQHPSALRLILALCLMQQIHFWKAQDVFPKISASASIMPMLSTLLSSSNERNKCRQAMFCNEQNVLGWALDLGNGCNDYLLCLL